MKKDKHKTVVIFRKLEYGHVIALFPYIKEPDYCCASYMHIGQHGIADYDHCVKISKLALSFEYFDLKKELESLGYNLQIKKKINRKSFKYINQ